MRNNGSNYTVGQTSWKYVSLWFPRIFRCCLYCITNDLTSDIGINSTLHVYSHIELKYCHCRNTLSRCFYGEVIPWLLSFLQMNKMLSNVIHELIHCLYILSFIIQHTNTIPFVYVLLFTWIEVCSSYLTLFYVFHSLRIVLISTTCQQFN